MQPACIVLALLLSPPAAPLAAATDPELARGIELVRAGEHAQAVLVLEAAARRLDREKGGKPQAAQAYLNLGIAHVGEGQEALARAAFREAASRDPGLRLDPFEASPKVRELFQKARDELAQVPAAAPPKKGRSKAPFLLGGLALAGGGAALAASSAADGGGGDASTFSIGICYETGMEANGPLVVAVTADFEVCSPGPGLDVASLSCSWDFGDGNQSTGTHVRHAWQAEGTAQVTLTARDARGGTATNRQTYTVRSLSGTWDGVHPLSGAFALTLSQAGSSLSGTVAGATVSGGVGPERAVTLSTSCGGTWMGQLESATRMWGPGKLPCAEGGAYSDQTLTRR